MAAIKKFFTKKKLDVKFKKAGTGHTLTEEKDGVSPRGASGGASGSGAQAHRYTPTVDAQRAGQAALERINKPRTVPRPSADVRNTARQELDAEAQALEKLNMSSGPKLVTNDAVPMAHAILFNCSDIGPAVLPKDEMDEYIKDFLLSQLDEEPEMTSAVMINTLNKDKDRVKICVDTLSKYLENIIANPGQEKYCKIKITNKAFQERVASVNGASEFLHAVGFQRKFFTVNDEEIDFYFLDEESALLTERLVNVREILTAAEPIRPQLDRAMKVFHPSGKSDHFTIPPEFYTISPEEFKREQQIRQEAVEKMGMLRTKAMRERDELKELRRYRYTLIRIRFPNGVLLQGTFKAHDKLPALYDFIRGCLISDWMPFNLTTMMGQVLSPESMESLVELGLAPSVILNFSWNESVMGDVVMAQGQSVSGYLSPDVMSLIQAL